MNDDLKIIKKKFGEEMMHFCRESFSTLMELYPRKLAGLLLNNFNCSRFLCEDIINNNLTDEFKNFIYGFVDVEKSNKIESTKTPSKLLEEAGYTLYKCESEEDIQQFKKYYSDEEKLCTFKGNRLTKCYVYFAVKNNVDEIRREDFPNPTRQDAYGTSVISIQFTKDESHTLSIKNRYNHRVNNPDATFSNNLDNIILGLTESFSIHEGMIQAYKKEEFEIPGYVIANDGKYYKYNYEIDNICYCPGNIIIQDFEPIMLPSEQVILADYYIIDYSKNTIKVMDDKIIDDFINTIGKIKNIEKIKDNEFIKIIITPLTGEDIIIKVDKLGNIIEYINDNVTNIGDYFLYWDTTLENIELRNVSTIGNRFLGSNKALTSLYLPNTTSVGNSFLSWNKSLASMNIPNISSYGDRFLECHPKRRGFIEKIYRDSLDKLGKTL